MRRLKQIIPTPLNTARVVATKIDPEHLQPGDLWSDRGPEYWSSAVIMDHDPFPASIAIRSNTAYDEGFPDPVYKLTIVITNSEIAAKQADVHTVSGDISPHSPPGMDYDEWINRSKS